MNLRDITPNATSRRLNPDVPELGGPGPAQAVQRPVERPAVALKARPTTDQASLNKTETEWSHVLEARKVVDLEIMAITFKLAHDCRYTPDFTHIGSDGCLWAWDVKGGHTWEDSLIKLRTAARRFRWVRFFVAEKTDGKWLEKEFKP